MESALAPLEPPPRELYKDGSPRAVLALHRLVERELDVRSQRSDDYRLERLWLRPGIAERPGDHRCASRDFFRITDYPRRTCKRPLRRAPRPGGRTLHVTKAPRGLPSSPSGALRRARRAADYRGSHASHNLIVGIPASAPEKSNGRPCRPLIEPYDNKVKSSRANAAPADSIRKATAPTIRMHRLALTKCRSDYWARVMARIARTGKGRR